MFQRRMYKHHTDTVFLSRAEKPNSEIEGLCQHCIEHSQPLLMPKDGNINTISETS